MSSTASVKDCSTPRSILQRIAGQDKAAVGECLDAYGKLIWALAKKYTRTPQDAEDAVQDIFIDVWKYAARFDAGKSPECAFVVLIARRRLIDRLRKSNLQPQTVLFEEAMQNRSSDADKKLHMFLEVRCLVKALNRLGLQQKQIVQMSIYGGMSHSEIAQTTGLPLGTVKSQIRRGFQKMRETI